MARTRATIRVCDSRLCPRHARAASRSSRREKVLGFSFAVVRFRSGARAGRRGSDGGRTRAGRGGGARPPVHARALRAASVEEAARARRRERPRGHVRGCGRFEIAPGAGELPRGDVRGVQRQPRGRFLDARPERARGDRVQRVFRRLARRAHRRAERVRAAGRGDHGLHPVARPRRQARARGGGGARRRAAVRCAGTQHDARLYLSARRVQRAHAR